MPVYEYECACGERMEAIRSIEKRHDMRCVCGKTPQLLISSWGRMDIISYKNVVGDDGTVVALRHSTEQIQMQPEKVHGSRY